MLTIEKVKEAACLLDNLAGLKAQQKVFSEKVEKIYACKINGRYGDYVRISPRPIPASIIISEIDKEIEEIKNSLRKLGVSVE